MSRMWANVALALMVLLCGPIVGLERERNENPAGIVTLSLICLGAAVFTMVSYLFNIASVTSVTGNPLGASRSCRM